MAGTGQGGRFSLSGRHSAIENGKLRELALALRPEGAETRVQATKPSPFSHVLLPYGFT